MNIPILINVIIENNAINPIILHPVLFLLHIHVPIKNPINNNHVNTIFLSII